METGWPRWIERHDREIRARLDQGDEDTIVNSTVFGIERAAKHSLLTEAGDDLKRLAIQDPDVMDARLVSPLRAPRKTRT